MNPTRLILLRHGKTEGQPGILYSQEDIPLSEEGWRQTEKLVQGLSQISPHVIYTSDLSRARVAAEKLARLTGAPLKVTPKLREIHFGDWTGKSFQELLSLTEFQKRLSSPEEITPPGGESLKDLARRASEVIEEICTQHKEKLVAVFTHGGLLRAVIALATGAGLKNFFRLHQDYASVNLIDYYPDGPVIRLINGPFDLNFKTLIHRQSLL